MLFAQIAYIQILTGVSSLRHTRNVDIGWGFEEVGSVLPGTLSHHSELIEGLHCIYCGVISASRITRMFMHFAVVCILILCTLHGTLIESCDG